jgi:glycosyltransferase involved in cell wall biosynthesis
MTPRRAFIVGAYRPSGGALMHYQIARLLAENLGFDVTIVTLRGERFEDGPWTKPCKFPTIALDDVQGELQRDDVYISSPVWDRNWIGATHPGPKISFVQSLSPWTVLDCAYDVYVSASSACQTLLREFWRLESRIIHPFCLTPEPTATPSWHDRPPTRVVVHGKGDEQFFREMLARIQRNVTSVVPGVQFDHLRPFGTFIPHSEVLSALDATRYLLTLSPSEGFGIVPLEAMARGVVVAGFDGIGGRDYMQPARNCECYPVSYIRTIEERLIKVLTDEAHAQSISTAAKLTPGHYSKSRFEREWLDVLSAVV